MKNIISYYGSHTHTRSLIKHTCTEAYKCTYSQTTGAYKHTYSETVQLTQVHDHNTAITDILQHNSITITYHTHVTAPGI